MSAQFWLVSTLTMVKEPDLTGSLKWWHLRDMCFILGLKFASVAAKTIQVLLSLYTLEDGTVDDKSKAEE